MSKMVIRRIGVLSVAKIYGVLMAVCGLIFGVIYGLFAMVFGAAMLSQSTGGSRAAAAGGVIGGLAALVMIPVFYAVAGFIIGALSALLYNAGASIIGGVELELESATPEYIAAPPPPPQWAPNQYSSSEQPR